MKVWLNIWAEREVELDGDGARPLAGAVHLDHALGRGAHR